MEKNIIRYLMTGMIFVFLIVSILAEITAADYIFENQTEDELMRISGDTGNVTITGNVTASWFKGIFDWIIGTASQIYLSFNGTQLDFNESQLNATIDTRISGSSGALHVNVSDWWNTGDKGALRNISQIQGSWLANDLSWINFTDGDDRYILLTEESNLNVNRSEWWSTTEGDLDNVVDILGSWLTNDLAWINFTDGDGRYLLITDESTLNVNASEYWITAEGIKNNVADILGSEITNDLNWLNATTLAAAETDPYWTGNQSSYFNITQILAFGYYNATDFVITDYFTKTEVLGFGYYNATDFVITDYFTKTEVLAFNYYNATHFNITDYFTKLEILGFDYYNASDFNITDYFTKSEVLGFGYYNISDFDINDYFTGNQILDFDYYNNTNFPYTHLSNFTDDILWTSGFNATGDARWLTSFTETDPKWTANYSTFLTHINWSQAVNGTLFTTALYNTNYTANDAAYRNMTNTSYYLASNPYTFWNSTFATFNKTYADTLYYGITNPFGFYNSTNPSPETLWTANYSTFLTHIDWSQAMNGTLMSQATFNTNYTANDAAYRNMTNTSYYLATNPYTFWNSTFATFNKTYADTLYYGIGNPSGFITWTNAVNGTLMSQATFNTNYSTNDPVYRSWSLNYSDYLTTKNYALNDSLWTANYSARTGSGNVVFSTSPVLTTPNIGAATAGGILNMSSYRIINVANATDLQDAVTLSQLQAVNATAIGAVPSTRTLEMTGTSNQITVSPTGPQDLSANRQWTFSLPQNINTTSSPIFSILTLSSLTPGSVLFAGANGLLSQNNTNFYWNNSNGRLGLGTNNPNGRLHTTGGDVIIEI